jgi:hypothetical protein
MQLFSRMVIRVRTRFSLYSKVQIENDRMHAVIATPNAQPAFRPMYRFVDDSTPPSNEPMTSARTVSCAMLSPRPL